MTSPKIQSALLYACPTRQTRQYCPVSLVSVNHLVAIYCFYITMMSGGLALNNASWRRDARTVYSIARRMRMRHLLSALIGIFIDIAAGVPVEIYLPLLGIIVLCEVLTEIGATLMPPPSNGAGKASTAFLFFICTLSCPAYVALGTTAMLYGGIAFLITGLIMCFGVMSHVTTTYAPFPLFNLAQILPSLALLIITLLNLHNNQIRLSESWEWFFPGVILFLYADNMLEMRSRTRETFLALHQTQRKANARLRELEHRSRHDTLTGLLNRKAFDELLSKKIATIELPYALLTFDLDGFKPVNDSYSHEAGDTVLREVANRFRRNLQDGDLAARLGGDEFVIATFKATDEDEMIGCAQSILDDIARPIPWHGTQLVITASVGISKSDHLNKDPKGLLSEADRAMYFAKTNQLQAPVLFKPGLFIERPTLQDRRHLSAAMESKEFHPFYQPKIDMPTGRSIGFEALARWKKPNGTIINPKHFITKIDELGLQGEFVQYITQAVLQDVSDWLAQGVDPGQVSINVSEAILATASARNDLLAAFERHPEARKYITLEITEDVFITRSGGQIRESIRMLRQAGLLISLDDFGTGFASFRHLRELEFDEIKIDATFVSALNNDPSAEILIKGLLSIAKGLDLQVIAEGVETREQCDALLRMGCRVAQGFLWSEALPAEKAFQRLVDQASVDPTRFEVKSVSNAG